MPSESIPVTATTRLVRLPSLFMLALIRLYQRLLRPLLPRSCRFHPSCSDYASEAVTRFGAVRGTILAGWRLARCHPFHPGGLDPVPERFIMRPQTPCSHEEATP